MCDLTATGHGDAKSGYEGIYKFMLQQENELGRLPRLQKLRPGRLASAFVFDNSDREEASLRDLWFKNCRKYGIERLICTVRKRRHGKPPFKIIGVAGGRYHAFVCYLSLPNGNHYRDRFTTVYPDHDKVGYSTSTYPGEHLSPWSSSYTNGIDPYCSRSSSSLSRPASHYGPGSKMASSTWMGSSSGSRRSLY